MADVTMLARAQSDLGFERPGCTLRQEPWLGVGRIQLRGGEPAGLTVPAARTQVETNGVTCAWLAPGEWLVTGAEGDVAAALARAGAGGLAVDLTHGRASFVLSGAEARTVLAALCPLDLWDRNFPVGAVARTLLGDTGMFLARLADRDGAPQFRIIVDQTMARYAARMLAGPQHSPEQP